MEAGRSSGAALEAGRRWKQGGRGHHYNCRVVGRVKPPLKNVSLSINLDVSARHAFSLDEARLIMKLALFLLGLAVAQARLAPGKRAVRVSGLGDGPPPQNAATGCWLAPPAAARAATPPLAGVPPCRRGVHNGRCIRFSFPLSHISDFHSESRKLLDGGGDGQDCFAKVSASEGVLRAPPAAFPAARLCRGRACKEVLLQLLSHSKLPAILSLQAVSSAFALCATSSDGSCFSKAQSDALAKYECSVWSGRRAWGCSEENWRWQCTVFDERLPSGWGPSLQPHHRPHRGPSHPPAASPCSQARAAAAASRPGAPAWDVAAAAEVVAVTASPRCAAQRRTARMLRCGLDCTCCQAGKFLLRACTEQCSSGRRPPSFCNTCRPSRTPPRCAPPITMATASPPPSPTAWPSVS